jgi:hypothetical protein
MDFWYILWHFGIFCGHLVYYPRFGILSHEKFGNPDVVPHVGVYLLKHGSILQSSMSTSFPKHIGVSEKNKYFLSSNGYEQEQAFAPGLPDFSWFKIPKRGKLYQISTKYTKWP